ncbi:Teneurin-m [Portunus trituberculatus]|uniref:Teneurin-m n=1 Tax=Portunus trituberculatus TaxID=210409 RepID=A0A5B7I668_PORTR|nr:Teneurin-m [Portunus trituberculatus]
MQLTPDHIPATLRRVHLRIVLEGTLFTRVFEADPNIKFTYAWDRYNVYRQRVHGVTVALVSVGYEHASCPKIVWEHQTTRVAGNDLLISMVGGFNFNIHHTYNYHQGEFLSSPPACLLVLFTYIFVSYISLVFYLFCLHIHFIIFTFFSV